jgi:2-polyprenyl-3-methyl-5-hydroxy-6-metoxy-1,4-benzoquinol methylase
MKIPTYFYAESIMRNRIKEIIDRNTRTIDLLKKFNEHILKISDENVEILAHLEDLNIKLESGEAAPAKQNAVGRVSVETVKSISEDVVKNDVKEYAKEGVETTLPDSIKRYSNVYNDWPLATVSSNIVSTDRDKWVRANLIAPDYIKVAEPILDYGCGEGHLVVVLNNRKKLTYGYDIRKNKMWSGFKTSSDKFLDSESLSDQKFKSIIMYDVIDHVVEVSAVEMLENVHDLLDDDGRLYISAHPFSSSHGGHLYQEENKAYIHLLLDDEELSKYQCYIPNIKITRPQAQYNKLFGEKFKIVKKELVTNRLDKWIVDNILGEVHDRWYKNVDIEQVKKILEISKINYELEKI